MVKLNITADDLDNLKHMLGVNSHTLKKNWGYRNYFCSCKSGSDYESMVRLVAAELVEKGNENKHSIYFHATRKGCEYLNFNKKQIANALE